MAPVSSRHGAPRRLTTAAGARATDRYRLRFTFAGVTVRWKFYSKILKGDQARSNRLIAKGLAEESKPSNGILGPQMAHTHWSNLGHG
jgi:hypothetical protein